MGDEHKREKKESTRLHFPDERPVRVVAVCASRFSEAMIDGVASNERRARSCQRRMTLSYFPVVHLLVMKHRCPLK